MPFGDCTPLAWVDFALEDDDYYNPFKAARMLTCWFQIMLDEAGGDVDLAIRALCTGRVTNTWIVRNAGGASTFVMRGHRASGDS
jgi:hypothetical protein